jgi:hypothetical protein
MEIGPVSSVVRRSQQTDLQHWTGEQSASGGVRVSGGVLATDGAGLVSGDARLRHSVHRVNLGAWTWTRQKVACFRGLVVSDRNRQTIVDLRYDSSFS